MPSTGQQKPLNLPSGLFLIKYEGSEDTRHPPRVTLSVAPRSEASIEFVLPPDASEPVLWSPGAALVVRATRPSQLIVEVSASSPGGSLNARIQSIPLSTDPTGLAAAENDFGDVDTADFRLLGHLAGRGDVFAGAGEWLGGPAAPSRIEGISIDWPNKPRNFNLNYSVRMGGGSPAASELLEAGTYAGTRGRALPLVGATFEVSGSASNGHQLTADAIFLGSPQMRVSGRRIVLTGPTGREPLVGLRVHLGAIEEEALVPKAHFAPPAPEPNRPEKKKPGRVRVFRSNTRAERV